MRVSSSSEGWLAWSLPVQNLEGCRPDHWAEDSLEGMCVEKFCMAFYNQQLLKRYSIPMALFGTAIESKGLAGNKIRFVQCPVVASWISMLTRWACPGAIEPDDAQQHTIYIFGCSAKQKQYLPPGWIPRFSLISAGCILVRRLQNITSCRRIEQMHSLINLAGCLSCHCSSTAIEEPQPSIPQQNHPYRKELRGPTEGRTLAGSKSEYLRGNVAPAISPAAECREESSARRMLVYHGSRAARLPILGKENSRTPLQAPCRPPEIALKTAQISLRPPQFSYNQQPQQRSPIATNQPAREQKNTFAQPPAQSPLPIYRKAAVIATSSTQPSYQSPSHRSYQSPLHSPYQSSNQSSFQSSMRTSRMNSPGYKEAVRGQVTVRAVAVHEQVRGKAGHKLREEARPILKGWPVAAGGQVQFRKTTDRSPNCPLLARDQLTGSRAGQQRPSATERARPCEETATHEREVKGCRKDVRDGQERATLRGLKSKISFADNCDTVGRDKESSSSLQGSLAESQDLPSQGVTAGDSCVASEKGGMRTIQRILIANQNQQRCVRNVRRVMTMLPVNKKLSQIQCNTVNTIKSFPSDHESFLDIKFMENKKHVFNLS